MRDRVARRRDTQSIIDADPWVCTVYRQAADSGDDPTTFSFTGSVETALLRAVTAERLGYRLDGERSVAMGIWGILASYDTPKIVTGDLIIATQADDDSFTTTHNLLVVHSDVYPDHVDILAKERE